jgi:DNA replication and repair protein RecF
VTLSRLDFSGVRNLEARSLRELEQVNIFHGANGSGKTSLLEAVHLLGMARSFRSAHIKSVITHGQESCTVYGEIRRDSRTTLGVSRTRDGSLDAQVNGDKLHSRAELAEALPLQLIHADSFSVLTGGPVERRQFMDWGVFHVEHSFFRVWQSFQRAIKQRNSLLRRGRISDDVLRPWDLEIATSGAAIDAARTRYIEDLNPVFLELLARLSPGLGSVELRYRRGWSSDMSLEEALQQSQAADLQQGFTHVGPQRADIRIVTDGKPAAESLSRGQLKLVVCALKLAQGKLLGHDRGRVCTYLVDDLTAELDSSHCIQVAGMLEEMGAQVFITCIEQKDVAAIWPQAGGHRAMFHVEHGTIRREET